MKIIINPSLVELPGDFNEDGTIDLVDFGIMASNMNTIDVDYTDGDVNFDGDVDLETSLSSGRFSPHREAPRQLRSRNRRVSL